MTDISISHKASVLSRSKSAVREIMDYANPETFRKLGIDASSIISFGGGWVAHDSPEQLSQYYTRISTDDDLFYEASSYSPTFGLSKCRDAVALYEEGFYKMKDISADNVAMGASSTQLTYSLFQTMLNSEDTVLTLDPSYCNYPNQIFASSSANIERYPILDQHKWKYSFDADSFASRILETKPKMVLLTSPDNPGSQVIPQKFMNAALEATEDIGSLLVIDFAYKEMVFKQKYPKYFSWAPTENFCSVHSNSKWGRSLGRRLGWIEADPSLLAAMDTILGSSALCPDSMHQMVFTYYMKNHLPSFKTYVKRTNLKYQKAADATLKAIDKHLGFDRLKPQGGIYTCMNVNEEGSLFVEKMLKEAAVLFVPGWGFGRSTRNAVRISYGPLVNDLKKIDEGMQRVAEVISK